MSYKETRERFMADPVIRARIEAEVEEAYRRVALHELRAGRVTQAELAHEMGVSQRRVSAIEHSEDVQVSTLRTYLGHMGFDLELVAKSRQDDNERIQLQLG
jgi:transcriptional regulator with XRE-family HTH domain